jgi:hypothetical protein
MSVVFSAVTDRRYSFSKHPAENGIDFDVIVAIHAHTNAKFLRPFSLCQFGERDAENNRKM